MKSLVLSLGMVLLTAGCGGYGSGMGMAPAPTPNFSPPAGTYNGPQQVITITDGLQGATIYFTTDGSMPTLASPVYGGPFAINRSTRVEAIAISNGYQTSGVAVADYTLQ
jgi:hypothetical protein